MGNRLDLRMEVPSDAELRKLFDAVPMLNRYDVASSAVREAAKVVSREAKKRAPRGNTRDRAKQSAKHKEKWKNQKPLHTTIGYVVRKYTNASFAAVGPKWPHGNKAYLNNPKSGTRPHVLWGKNTGRVYRAQENFIRAAFDATKSQQLNAMKAVLRRKIEEMYRG